jgi:hypothetical protein
MNDHTESITNNRDRTHGGCLYFLLFPDIYFSLTCPVEAHPPSPSPVHVSPTLTTLSSPLKRDPHFPILFRWQHTPPSSSFFFFSVIDLLICLLLPSLIFYGATQPFNWTNTSLALTLSGLPLLCATQPHSSNLFPLHSLQSDLIASNGNSSHTPRHV